MRHAMGERVGLAGSGTGNYQQRRTKAGRSRAMLDGAPLLRIEIFEIGGSQWHGTMIPEVKTKLRDSRSADNGLSRPYSRKDRPLRRESCHFPRLFDSWPNKMNKSRTIH